MDTSKKILKEFSLSLEEAAACGPGKPPFVATLVLASDIHEVFPYLNRKLRAVGFVSNPPGMIVKKNGRQIALESNKITISNIGDESEALDVSNWLVEVINDVWNERDAIEAKFDSFKELQVVDILARLPKTNCGDCGEPSCMAFAVKLIKGHKEIQDCFGLVGEKGTELEKYFNVLSGKEPD